MTVSLLLKSRIKIVCERKVMWMEPKIKLIDEGALTHLMLSVRCPHCPCSCECFLHSYPYVRILFSGVDLFKRKQIIFSIINIIIRIIIISDVQSSEWWSSGGRNMGNWYLTLQQWNIYGCLYGITPTYSLNLSDGLYLALLPSWEGWLKFSLRISTCTCKAAPTIYDGGNSWTVFPFLDCLNMVSI